MNLANSEQEKNEIKQTFAKSKDLLQTVLYTYSTDAIYRNFNNCFATDSYEKILETLTFTFSCVLEEMKKPSKKISPETKLYRGVRGDRTDLHRTHNTTFWKAFTSASEKLEVAEGFTNPGSDGTVFEISLSQKMPHPHLRLLPEWSSFPFEKEILIWPYFAFHTVAIIKPKDKWYQHVILEQDEDFLILQDDRDKLKEWWSNFITKQIDLPLSTFFHCLTKKIQEVTDFPKFIDQNLNEIHGEMQTLLTIPQRNEKLFRFLEANYFESIRKQFFLVFDKQQNQKRWYELVIRDMKIREQLMICKYL